MCQNLEQRWTISAKNWHKFCFENFKYLLLTSNSNNLDFTGRAFFLYKVFDIKIFVFLAKIFRFSSWFLAIFAAPDQISIFRKFYVFLYDVDFHTLLFRENKFSLSKIFFSISVLNFFHTLLFPHLLGFFIELFLPVSWYIFSFAN